MDDHLSEKKRLRRGANARAAECSAERQLLDAAITEKFLAAFPPDPTKILSFFWPMARECDTRGIAQICSDAGMTCALPVVREDAHGLLFRQWAPGTLMKMSRFGTMEPLDTSPVVEPDILLVPLVMIDRQGNRLGRGAGHYDATISPLRAKKTVLAIGIAYDWQISEELIPAENHDQRLDGLITPEQVVLFP